MATSGLEKAAILLGTLGPEAAAAVFRHLSEPEVRQIAAAIARLRTIPHAQAAAVHEEASRRLAPREGLLLDGEALAREALAASFPGRSTPEEPRPSGGGHALATSLEPVAPASLARLLRHEHPQLAAVVLASLGAEKAAEVLRCLPDEVQSELVTRIGELTSVPEDLLAEVGTALRTEALRVAAPPTGPALVGAKVLADMLTAGDPAVEERLSAHLEQHAPALAARVRELAFTFEDLARLDESSLQGLLREVSRDDLLLALKTASPALRDVVFRNLSVRAAALLREDVAALGPVRLRDVENAQARIVSAARRLAGERRTAGADQVVE